MTKKKKAITAMLISALAFSMMGVFIKFVGPIPTQQKAILRSITIMLASYIMLRKSNIKISSIKHFKLLNLRSALGTFGILCNYYAIDHLILSDSNVIFRLSTVFLLISSYIFLKEKLHLYQISGIILAFIGVTFIIKPAFSFDIFPFIIAVIGAILAALSYTTLRVLGKREQPVTVVFYFSTFTSVALSPFVIVSLTPMSPIQLLFAFAAGICAFIGQMGVTIAYKHAPAKEVSIYNYLGVIFSAIFSIVLFDAVPDILSFIGYIIVFASAFYMYKKQVQHL